MPEPVPVPDEKRVSLIELFYDLVFVYMVSRATELLHHTQGGVIQPVALAVYALVVIVFVNSWMFQVVYTNRYGRGSWTDMFFSLLDMAIVLYMSNAFGAGFDRNMATFFIAAGLLSLTSSLQYLLAFCRSAGSPVDRRITAVFAAIPGIRGILMLIGGLTRNWVGLGIALAGILFSWIAPAFTGRYTRRHPIIFPHLLERLTALTIVMFGETIVGIAGYFTRTTFGIGSVLIFLTVAALFFTYIVEFDHLIDGHRVGETGNLLIYLHYFILFGLSLMTGAIELLGEDGLDRRFVAGLFFTGLALFYIGLALADRYNKGRFYVTLAVRVVFALVSLCGLCITMIWPTTTVITVSITAVTVANAAVISGFLMCRGGGRVKDAA